MTRSAASVEQQRTHPSLVRNSADSVDTASTTKLKAVGFLVCFVQDDPKHSTAAMGGSGPGPPNSSAPLPTLDRSDSLEESLEVARLRGQVVSLQLVLDQGQISNAWSPTLERLSRAADHGSRGGLAGIKAASPTLELHNDSGTSSPTLDRSRGLQDAVTIDSSTMQGVNSDALPADREAELADRVRQLTCQLAATQAAQAAASSAAELLTNHHQQVIESDIGEKVQLQTARDRYLQQMQALQQSNSRLQLQLTDALAMTSASITSLPPHHETEAPSTAATTPFASLAHIAFSPVRAPPTPRVQRQQNQQDAEQENEQAQHERQWQSQQHADVNHKAASLPDDDDVHPSQQLLQQLSEAEGDAARCQQPRPHANDSFQAASLQAEIGVQRNSDEETYVRSPQRQWHANGNYQAARRRPDGDLLSSLQLRLLSEASAEAARSQQPQQHADARYIPSSPQQHDTVQSPPQLFSQLPGSEEDARSQLRQWRQYVDAACDQNWTASTQRDNDARSSPQLSTHFAEAEEEAARMQQPQWHADDRYQAASLRQDDAMHSSPLLSEEEGADTRIQQRQQQHADDRYRAASTPRDDDLGSGEQQLRQSPAAEEEAARIQQPQWHADDRYQGASTRRDDDRSFVQQRGHSEAVDTDAKSFQHHTDEQQQADSPPLCGDMSPSRRRGYSEAENADARWTGEHQQADGPPLCGDMNPLRQRGFSEAEDAEARWTDEEQQADSLPLNSDINPLRQLVRQYSDGAGEVASSTALPWHADDQDHAASDATSPVRQLWQQYSDASSSGPQCHADDRDHAANVDRSPLRQLLRQYSDGGGQTAEEEDGISPPDDVSPPRQPPRWQTAAAEEQDDDVSTPRLSLSRQQTAEEEEDARSPAEDFVSPSEDDVSPARLPLRRQQTAEEEEDARSPERRPQEVFKEMRALQEDNRQLRQLLLQGGLSPTHYPP